MSAQTSVSQRGYKTLLQPLAHLRGLTLKVALASLVTASLEGISIVLIVPLLHTLDGSEATPSALKHLGLDLATGSTAFFVVCFFVFLLVAAKGFVTFKAHMYTAQLEAQTLMTLRSALLKACFNRPYCLVAGANRGQLLNMFNHQAQACSATINTIVNLFNALVLIALYALVLLYFSRDLTLLAFVLVGVSLLVTYQVNKTVTFHAMESVKNEERLSHLFLDDLSGIAEVKTLGLSAARAGMHDAVNERAYYHNIRQATWQGLTYPTLETFYTTTFLVFIALAYYLNVEWLKGNVPWILAFFFIFLRLRGRFGVLTQGFYSLAENKFSTVNVLDFISQSVKKSTGTESSPLKIDEVVFKNAGFSFENSSFQLQGISFTAIRGKVLALVGKTGSGKTTIVRLCAGLLTANTGEIRLSGTDIKQLDAGALANHLGVAFQDAHFFDETILWNITCGRAIAPEQAEWAARVASVDKFVASLPQGYHTRAGDIGQRLSRGERQRLAIARAIAGKPDLLLLDEATASLDGDTEHKVLTSVISALKESVIIVVSHQPEILKLADHVVVVDQGGIIAQGAPSVLAQDSPLFRQMFQQTDR